MSKPMVQGGALLDRPVAETSLEEVAAFFAAAAKPRAEWMIGMEIELFAFERETRAPAAYPALSGLLEALGAARGMTQEHEQSGALIGLKGGGVLISLEPGGQLELATKPHRALAALRDEVMDYTGLLRRLAAERGLAFWTMGYHPFADRATTPKMPKARYDIMRAYFADLGGRGLDMMHCTASVQCAVDFDSEANMVDKIRTAARASPFIAALVAGSPFGRGKPNGRKTDRYQVWLETDDERSGLWPEMLDREGLTFHRYLERALTVPPYFFMRGGRHRRAPRRPFAEFVRSGFEESTVTVRDLVDHLTTLFPEIRPKGYIELRSADCVPPAEAVAVAGFWRSVLDDEAVRREVEERLRPLGYAELKALQGPIAALGLDASSPLGPVRDTCRWLMRTAFAGLDARAPDCAQCLLPLVDRAERGRSPADDLLEAAAKGSVERALEQVVL